MTNLAPYRWHSDVVLPYRRFPGSPFLRFTGSRLYLSSCLLLLAGCSGTGNGDDPCALPNAIIGFAFVPNPAISPAPIPPGNTVRDPEGRSDIVVWGLNEAPPGFVPLSGALVVIQRTTLSIRTGNDGFFSFAALSAGVYQLEITAEGHQPLRFDVPVCNPQREDRTTSSSSDSDSTPGSGGGSSGSGSGSNGGSGSSGGSSAGGGEPSSSFSRTR